MDEIYSAVLENIKEIDQRDEKQVLAELAGEAVAEYIYDTEVWDWTTDDQGKRKKKKVHKIKLSWVGTRETARARGNIMVSDPVVTETDDAIRVMVKATDLTHNFSVFGGCHMPKKMKVNDWDEAEGRVTGTHLEDDPFAFQKGLSKAQRNALGAYIPADWAAKCIAKWLSDPRYRGALAGGTPRQYVTQGQRDKNEQRRLSSQLKPRAEWDKVTRAMVSSYEDLEKVAWDLAKLQPKEMYQELGGGSKTDMNIPAWDAFLTLKQRYVPSEKPG
jgi:hypothetical protein